MSHYIRPSNIKKLAKEKGKRVGKDFLVTLDAFIHEKIETACSVHNGGKITLDQTVANYVGLNPKK